MKFNLKNALIGAGLLLAPLVASAQSVTVSDVSASPGTTTPAISIDYVAGGNVVGFQFDILYDDPTLNNPALMCNGDLGGACSLTCSNPSPGRVRVICFDASLAVQPSGNIGTFTLDLDAAAPLQVYPLTIDATTGGAGFSDNTGASVPATLNDGSVTAAITGAAGYGSTPAPGSTITFTPTDVGSAAPTEVVTVSEIGDQTLDVTALTISGANAGDFSTPQAPFMIVDGGAAVPVDLNCTPSSRGTNVASIEFTNNSANAPAASYDLACAGTSPNVAVSTMTVNLNGVIGGTAPTGSFDITNADDGFTSDATNAALAESGTAEISITDGLADATISVDEVDPVTVSCSTATSGMFSETISLTYDDALAGGGTGQIDVTVNCDIANAVPSYLGNPTSGSTITFPTTTNGTTSAPLGIDVSNDGVGPSPASDLNITSATVADMTQFAVTVNDNGPFVVGDPAVADAITVTCSPSAGATGTITTTLTVVHNGDDTDATYTLDCPTASDATFASTPADGGTLNLGIVPPVTMTPPGDITFSNTGAADSYDISCTVTDPDGVFTFTPDPIQFTVGPGASSAATFQCTPAAPQIYQADVACTITGADVATANYTVSCAGQPLVVPTMNRWGLILLAMVMLALGGLAGRRMMA